MTEHNRPRNGAAGSHPVRRQSEEAKAQAVAKNRKRRHKKYVILLAVEIAALLIVSLLAVGFFYIKSRYDVMTVQDQDISFERHDIKTNEGIDDKLDEINEKYQLIMAYGVDARNNTDLLKDANADTDIIVCINKETKQVKLVSVLRDSFLCMTNGKYRKLTDIYAGYGVKESIETINKNFDLNITQYVTVNWKALAKAVDILGGIDVEVTNAEIRQINEYGKEVSKVTGYKYREMSSGSGERHLTGEQAVAFARIRNVTIDGEGHDIARATRQRKVINAMLVAAKDAGISELNNLLSEVLPMAATNISFSEALSLASDVGSYTISDQATFPFDYVDQSNLTTAYVYYKTLVSNVSDLHALLFGDENYQPTSTVQNISSYIDQYRRDHP